MGEDEVALSQFNGHIICEPPNSNLSRFEGTMEWEGRKYAIGKLYLIDWWNILLLVKIRAVLTVLILAASLSTLFFKWKTFLTLKIYFLQKCLKIGFVKKIFRFLNW